MILLPQALAILAHPATPSGEILSAPILQVLEEMVSAHRGTLWRAQTFQDLIDLASHPCGILADESYAIFAKLSRAANGLDQFEVEMAGLRFLAAQAGVQIPTPIGIIPLEGACLLVMEAAQAIPRGPQQWREIGRTLAQIHCTQGHTFGFAHQGYFGPTYQDNRPMDDWVSFYSERRLWPGLTAAINAGQLPSDIIRKVEKLILRLPDMNIPPVAPVLLHGDAQSNNYISTMAGTMVIDPAVFCGSPEYDLANLETFQPVPSDVMAGYQEELAIPPGFYDRCDLWRIASYLLCVALEGKSYLPQLSAAVEKYL
jgi:protein-ribulosamine 3-kinase